MNKKINFFLLFLITIAVSATAQNPYVLNGSASQDNCHCYTLTREINFQSGSIWNKNKIDLSQPFDYFFSVYLGCIDLDGADGIAFVLQPVSTSLGSAGQGIGFGGIVPSLGVVIDTYQNFDDSDPYFDHVTIQTNGDVNHTSSNNLAGPATALQGSDNIEDCKWHVFEINWNPATDSMKVSIDGNLRLSIQNNIITSVFNNDPLVYWGFTSATGGSVNIQQMCTSLDAKFKLAAYDNTCIGTPLTFLDSSVSFGAISNWYWDFGDGNTSNVKNPPTHNYASPGVYNVKLNVLSGDGCVSDTFKKQITIGSYPVADFKTNITPICTNRNAIFTDETTLEVGTEDYWYWNFGNGTTSNEQNPQKVNYTIGNYDVQFFVNTKEGCASDTAEKNFSVLQAPAIDFTTQDACRETPVLFTAVNLNKNIGIQQWYLDFDDNNFSLDSTIYHTYIDTGHYNTSLVAKASNGCLSDTITKPVIIYGTYANAGADTTILLNYPYQLQASGGGNYTWSPSSGLDNPFIANPVATLNSDISYVVTATTVLGCATKDTINLKVLKGPEIYIPTAFTPNGDGLNDRFKIFPVGITNIRFFRIYNRWGQVVYSSENSAQGWDGTMNGIAQPAGTYTWVVAGKTINDVSVKKSGTVVLIR